MLWIIGLYFFIYFLYNWFSFLSKFIENFLSYWQISVIFSACRPFHSTKFSLYKCITVVFETRSLIAFSCLIVLDFSAAFDSVAHYILFERFSKSFGFPISFWICFLITLDRLIALFTSQSRSYSVSVCQEQWQ